ncbi:MAG: TadE/TadG family type IV pilus assembly protein [Nocardioides sp.]|uniref:TadE/TadG family type IV pilus assembly protein n=1 Tax=Nocardioides sp. TaxID=35761 RepID=UPI003F0FE4B0
MRILQRRARDEKGAAAVEFALVMPVLLILVFGIIDFGLYFNRYAAVSNAAREGVRSASLGAKTGDINAVVKDFLSDLNTDEQIQVQVSCKTPTGGNCTSFDAGAVSGGTATVTVTVTQDWATPFGATFSDHMTLTKTSKMRIE